MIFLTFLRSIYPTIQEEIDLSCDSRSKNDVLSLESDINESTYDFDYFDHEEYNKILVLPFNNSFGNEHFDDHEENNLMECYFTEMKSSQKTSDGYADKLLDDTSASSFQSENKCQSVLDDFQDLFSKELLNDMLEEEDRTHSFVLSKRKKSSDESSRNEEDQILFYDNIEINCDELISIFEPLYNEIFNDDVDVMQEESFSNCLSRIKNTIIKKNSNPNHSSLDAHSYYSTFMNRYTVHDLGSFSEFYLDLNSLILQEKIVEFVKFLNLLGNDQKINLLYKQMVQDKEIRNVLKKTTNKKPKIENTCCYGGKKYFDVVYSKFLSIFGYLFQINVSQDEMYVMIREQISCLGPIYNDFPELINLGIILNIGDYNHSTYVKVYLLLKIITFLRNPCVLVDTSDEGNIHNQISSCYILLLHVLNKRHFRLRCLVTEKSEFLNIVIMVYDLLDSETKDFILASKNEAQLSENKTFIMKIFIMLNVCLFDIKCGSEIDKSLLEKFILDTILNIDDTTLKSLLEACGLIYKSIIKDNGRTIMK